MLWVPASVTHFSQNDFFYDQPARAQTVCSYRTDLDSFSPPFCLNLITLHLGECHYKLWGYNSVVSNECSIKQRAPTRQTGSNKANWMLSNWHSLFLKSHWSLESTTHKTSQLKRTCRHPALSDVRTLETVLTGKPMHRSFVQTLKWKVRNAGKYLFLFNFLSRVWWEDWYPFVYTVIFKLPPAAS